MNDHNEKIWNIIQNTKVGMLTTSGDMLRARPMHVVQESYEGKLWFFIDLSSDTVGEVEDKQVCLSFCEQHGGSYLSLTGHATLITEKSLIDQFWNSTVATWIPEGKEGSNVGLICIDVNFGEYWINDKTKVGTFFEIAKAKLSKQRPDLGENNKFKH